MRTVVRARVYGLSASTLPTKTMVYALHFAQVYHLTDVPSFVSGEFLVLFDPHACYLPGVSTAQPGACYVMLCLVYAWCYAYCCCACCCAWPRVLPAGRERCAAGCVVHRVQEALRGRMGCTVATRVSAALTQPGTHGLPTTDEHRAC